MCLFLLKIGYKEKVNDNEMICSERLEACSRRLINESGLDAGLAFPTVSLSFPGEGKGANTLTIRD